VTSATNINIPKRLDYLSATADSSYLKLFRFFNLANAHEILRAYLYLLQARSPQHVSGIIRVHKIEYVSVRTYPSKNRIRTLQCINFVLLALDI